MKHLKKLASIVLALVMVLAMAIPVMAEETTPSITIKKTATDDKTTYNIYKIFDLTYSGDNYSYKIVEDWLGFFFTDPDELTGFDGHGLVTSIDGTYVKAIESVESNTSVVQSFAQEARQYAEDNKIGATATATIEEKATETTVTVNALGYYLVDSTVGTLCSLDSTNPTANIEDKNKEPTLEKKVEESGVYGEENDASIGDTVNFQATITVEAGAENYVMHDEMSPGLSFESTTGISKITRERNGSKITLTKDIDYQVIIPDKNTNNKADDCTFEIEFLTDLQERDVIVVSYSATVNANAEIRNKDNPNSAYLSYGENHRTTPSETKTYVWDFDILKTDGTAPLKDADFSLKNENGEEIWFVKKSADSDTVPLVYKVATSDEKANKEAVNSFTTNSTGKIKFEGLDSGTYSLTETKAPDGYNTPNTAFTVSISKTGDVTLDGNSSNNDGECVIENHTGVVLPGTGGIGTTIFYIVGGILVVGAAVILVSKKRTKDE